MNICVVGSGYVGLVTGACFAEFGLKVTCVDNDKKKIDALNSGVIPIYEPGLEEMVKKNMRDGNISFSTDLSDAVSRALVIFIAVGTPPKPDGSADLSYVEEVAKSIAENMNGYKVIVTKSTVPVGTGERIRAIVSGSQLEKNDFDIVSNPEFLREGSAIGDFMHPNRVVIGANSEQAMAIMKDLYSPLYLIETPFVLTNVETAEMIKYASNAFLATKISFINEVANICELVGADVHKVAVGMGLDNRIGGKFLHPGPGFGGSCFPKDTQAIVRIAKEHGYDFSIVGAVLDVNERQKERMVGKIVDIMGGDVSGKTIAVLGLSFKPNTDDMRDAPSVPIIKALQAKGAKVRAHDPVAMEEAKKFLPEITFSEGPYECSDGADALVIMTEWNQFLILDLKRLKDLMKNPVVADLRNVYEPARMRAEGFTYTCVGRP
ncbi:MAG: UDP-glucose/GDP-mannose dehydrogenase family protein [Nitrospirae bacterium]|nr:UDP-glucose/GDP-mannose dehydrogenase family protein [Nitrospirota bacterium]